jgi:hypothetical protein
MKITMLRNVAKHIGVSLMEGETGEVEDKLAESLIQHNLAVPVAEQEKKKIKAVPESPSVKGE